MGLIRPWHNTYHLLLQQRYTVFPYYLKIWLEDGLAHLGTFPWGYDVETCRLVCEQYRVSMITYVRMTSRRRPPLPHHSSQQQQNGEDEKCRRELTQHPQTKNASLN